MTTYTASGARVGRPPGPATCQIEGCGQPGPTVRAMCKKHYTAWKRSLIIVAPRTCDTCGETKPIQAFHGRSQRRSGFMTCTACRRVQRPQRYAGRVYDWHLRAHYGMTQDDFDALLEAQGGGCAICKRTSHGDGTHRLHIDHDHETGKVRGILCASCNRGLGYFQDNAERIAVAAAYLQTHKE